MFWYEPQTMNKVLTLLFFSFFHYGTAYSIPKLEEINISKIHFGAAINICTPLNSNKIFPSQTSVLEFKTPVQKHSFDLSISHLTEWGKLSLKLYDDIDGLLVWSNENISSVDDYKVSWVSLLTDKKYFLVIDSKQANDLEVLIEYSLLTIPPNDLCEDAEVLFGGEIGCDAFFQTFLDPCATADSEATGNCVDPSDPGIWYTFTTPDPLPFNSFFFNISPSNFEVFSTSSDCSGLVYEDCGNIFSLDAMPATTYYILVAGNFVITTQNSIGGVDGTCSDPFTWFDMGPGISSIWLNNHCQDPSPIVPCPNENSVWVSYETGCEISDITIEVEPFTTNWGDGPADDISITLVEDDCNTLFTQYDVNGTGFVCSGLVAGESINLEDVPPATSFFIVLANDANELGNYTLILNEENTGTVGNDDCDDLILLSEGVNTGFSNLCASSDIDIPNCFGQSNNTVWFQYDAGPDPVDLEISVILGDISEPAIAALDGCSGTFLGQDCSGNLQLDCVSGLFIIEVASSDSNAGSFDLEINSSPALSPPDPIFDLVDICSGDNASLNISFPGGELVDITVSISPSSSSNINGMSSQQFSGVNSVDITEILTNNSTSPEIAVYTISTSGDDFTCPSQPTEVNFVVFPEFNLTSTSFEGCSPYNLLLSANDLIQGGGSPYASYQWIWNGFDLIDDDDFLDYDFSNSGLLTLEVIDANNCSTFNDVPLTITEELHASFDFPLFYCRSDQEIIYLPTTSLEGIEGNWTPSIVELDFYPDGFVDLVFEPIDPMCNLGVSYEIELYSGNEVTFNLPSIICSNEDFFEFPTTSSNGLNGSWETPVIDLSLVSGTMTNYFTVNSPDCYEIYEYEFEIGDQFELNFDLPEELCLNTNEFTLPTTSLDGFTGTWSTGVFNQANIINNVFSSTWTPDPGQSACLGEYVASYNIAPIIQPMFALPLELCQNDPVYTLPIMTIDQSTLGSWDVQEINPSQLSGPITVQFTPDDTDCVAVFETSINIIPSLVPAFNIDTALCVLDGIVLLQLNSDNNITGNWTIPQIDPALYAGQQIETTFVPDGTQACIESTSLTFQVQAAQIPAWTIDNIICPDAEDLVLPTNSNNGISGSWTTPIIQVEQNLGEFVVTEFIPNDLCVQTTSITFEVLASHNVTAQATDPSDCDTENGSIELSNTNPSLEYSIDGGITWQNDIIFDQLAAGFYNIIVRSQSYPACVETINISLSANEAPLVDLFEISNIISCLDQTGSILIEATGINLTFTIDDGLSWQNSGLFENLPAGDYNIEVIQDGSTECALELTATINDIIETEIIQVNSEMLSDCGTNDGSIEILASGQNLQYSIDGGLSFSENNIFYDLDAGEYLILIQAQELLDCDASEIVSIEAPNAPSFINITGVDPTDCFPNTGEIEIEALGENLQYSIDGGITWQNQTSFSELSEGIYTLLVQDELNPNCNDEIDYALIQIYETLEEPQLIITPLLECNAADATLTVLSNDEELEFSLDNGLTWQNQTNFQGLSSGNYALIIRKINAIDCMLTLSFEIENPDCPCNDLEVDFLVNNTSCIDIENPSIEIISIIGNENSDIQLLWDQGETTSLITDVNDGWHFITIFYDEICEWKDSIFVSIEEPISFEWSTIDSDCSQINNGLIDIFNITGGNGEYQFSIDGNSLQQEPQFYNLSQGSYPILVTDSNGCTHAESISIENTSEIEIILPDILALVSGQEITLDPQIQESSIDSFSWTSAGAFLNPDELIAQVAPVVNTSYLLEIFYGLCVESHEIQIEVINEEIAADIYVNNIISINNTTNNILFAQANNSNQIEITSLSIYDRWGNLIYYSQQLEINNMNSGWNGLYHSEKVNPGVYVYKLDYKNKGEDQIKVGTVTVID